MSNDFPTYSNPATTHTQANVDAGLKAFMQGVYNRMMVGLAITFATAWFASNSETVLQLIMNPMASMVLMLSPLALIWFGFRPDTMSSKQLQASFMLLSVLYGLSFAVIFLVYVPGDIVRALLMTTIMFAGLSITGYVTKRDLAPLGVFCVMGMFGLLAFSLLYALGTAFSVVEASPMINNMISVVTIIVFAGLTAWETQMTKEMYNRNYSPETLSKMAWAAALNLYISFIAMFQSILQLMGNRE